MTQYQGVPLVWLPRQRVRELVVLGACLVLKEPPRTYTAVPASGELVRWRAQPRSRQLAGRP